jgi:hypothetical protein
VSSWRGNTATFMLTGCLVCAEAALMLRCLGLQQRRRCCHDITYSALDAPCT